MDADTNTLRERSKHYREQVEKFRTQADDITQTAEDVKAAILSVCIHMIVCLYIWKLQTCLQNMFRKW